MTRISLVFTTISKEEWRAFRLACLKNGEPMTQVLLKAVREYIKKGGKDNG